MRRSEKSPILTREDVPDFPGSFTDPTSVMNPGAVLDGDVYRLMLRVQARSRETFLVMADSADGVRFTVSDRLVSLGEVDAYHVYDPRITRLDEAFYVVFAADVDEGCRLGVSRTVDFESFDLLGLGPPDARNGVLFPEKVGGRYVRLERPNSTGMSGDEIWLAESDDLAVWRPVAPVMCGRPHYWDELIGSGPPPVRTSEGWLGVYHGIATHGSLGSIYQAGAVLLDLEDPTRVIARTRQNILEPREPYELTGQVPNVVFPSGMIVEEDGTVLVYYGAADTCVGLAVTTVEELIEACHE
ncbi:MAG: glycoside hydrolase family 130 protein [Planctomycetota bacterium]|jgi:beta-1,4-mannooligosaccharide/beta-1,4-mannosyl-N-acetylglucosamine phosphorylase